MKLDKLRIAIGGIRHETNTFSPIWTEYEDFKSVWGPAILEGGLGKPRQAKEVEFRPTFITEAVPSGLICKTAYMRFKTQLLSKLQATLPLDGVYLDLRGAMEIEEIGGHTDR